MGRFTLTDDRRQRLALFIAFLGFNIAIASLFQYPVSYPDEYGVLAAAKFISSGTAWTVDISSYFGFAHSILFSILFHLLCDFQSIYTGALCVNAVLISLIPVLVHKSLRELLNVNNSSHCVLITVAVSLFPCFTLFSKLTRNEPLLYLIMFICIYLLGKNLSRVSKRNTCINSALLAFVLCYAYAAHGLGIVFIAATLITILLSKVFIKRNAVNYLMFFISLTVFYFLSDVFRDYIKDTVYGGTGNLTNTLEYNFRRVLLLFSNGGFLTFLKLIAARLHYICTSSFGTFMLSIGAMAMFFRQFYKNRLKHENDTADRDKTVFVLLCFAVLLFIGALAVSSLNNISVVQNQHGSYYVYGRYYEYTFAPLLMFGLSFLISREDDTSLRVKKGLIFSSAGVFTILSIFIKVFLESQLLEGVKKRYSIEGVLPMSGNSPANLSASGYNTYESYDVILMGVIALCVLAILGACILRHKPKLLAGTLSTCFIFVIIFNLTTTMVPFSRSMHNFYEPYAKTNEQLKMASVYDSFPKLCVVTRGKDPTSRMRTQLAMVDKKVNVWTEKSAIENKKDPSSELKGFVILSLHDEKLEELDSDFVRLPLADTACNIWVCAE